MVGTRNTNRRPEARGFTLVELLVVVSIIALLIAILLPALSQAKQQAMTIKCAAHLREIGKALYMYSTDNRGYWPVVRHDGNLSAMTPATYWSDMLGKYLTKSGFNYGITGATDKEAAMASAKNTVIWGCPLWEGRPGTGSMSVAGSSIFDSGYGMQHKPGYRQNYPAAGGSLQVHDYAAVSIAIVSAGGQSGRFHRQTEWTQPSERIIIADSRIWLLNVSDSKGSGKIQPQPADYTSMISGDGAVEFDRFRHGRRPASTKTGIDDRRGKVAFNALYCDGHVATLRDVKEGYKGVRMQNP